MTFQVPSQSVFLKGGECESCATWLFASSFVANKDKRGARGGRKAGREGEREGGWGLSWTLSKLRRLPRWRVSSFFIKVCQLGYSDNSILCQYTKTEGVRVIQRGSWSVTKRKKKRRRRARQSLVILFFASYRHSVFYTTFTDSANSMIHLGTFLYNLLNHWNYIISTCSQVTFESVLRGMLNFTQRGRVTNTVAGNESSSATVYRSISQDRLLYCYWCRYLVRHNWILKYNITHSSCWGLTFLSGYWCTFK